MKFKFLVFVLLSFVLISCKHDAVFEEHNVSFQKEILPVFKNNCALSGCHDVTTAKAQYVFTDYNSIILKGIVSGKAKESQVYKAIKGDLSKIMPPGGKLNNYYVENIKMWIDQGIKNDIVVKPDTTIPPVTCDTGIVTYNNQIKLLFNSKCVSCHVPGHISNCFLDSYANAKQYVDTNGIFLYNKVRNNTHENVILTDCQKVQLKKWIETGANQ